MQIAIGLCALIALVSGAAIQKWHKSNDGSLYFIETEQRYNWHQAWNECARKNMSLIAIDSYSKHEQIDPLLRAFYAKCPLVWVAGQDLAVDTRYEWTTTGDVFTFTNWGPNEPNRIGNNEHCILIWEHFFWVDLPCANKLGFICEEHRFLKENSHALGGLQGMSDYQRATEWMKYKNFLTFINGMSK